MYRSFHMERAFARALPYSHFGWSSIQSRIGCTSGDPPRRVQKSNKVDHILLRVRRACDFELLENGLKQIDELA